MITKFKKFFEKKPKVGDYILINPNYGGFYKSYIGEIVSTRKGDFDIIYYYVKYNSNDIGSTKDFVVEIRIHDILKWSKNKEDLEHMIQANKYNL